MRPDQDKRLTSMGAGHATCEKCTMELYRDDDVSICTDCGLNPYKAGKIEEFVKDAVENESRFSLGGLIARAKMMMGW